MNISDFYKKILNPIDNSKLIKHFAIEYMNSNDINSFYSCFVNKNDKTEFNDKEINEFYVEVFEEWKKHITEMSFKKFASLVKEEKYKKSFSKLRKFLEGLPKAKSKSEIDKIIFEDYKGKDQEISEILKTYYWNVENPKWETVTSNLVTVKGIQNPKVEHNLFLNIPNKHVYAVAKELFEKSVEYEIPYNFQIDKSGKMIDSIVIHTDSDGLMKYIKILNEIKHKKPEFISDITDKSYLAGRLANWIGYGSEPTGDGDENLSYYYTRVNLLSNSIKKANSDWIISFNDSDKYKEELSKYIVNGIKESFNDEKSKEILENNDLYQVLLESISDFIKDYSKDSIQGIDITDVETNESVTVNSEILNILFKSFIMENAINEADYIKSIQDNVKELSDGFNIDSNNFCFDKSVIDA